LGRGAGNWEYRGDVAQLPIRLGGEGEDGWVSGTVRPGGVRAQQQGGSPGVCETSVDEIAVVGGIRRKSGKANNRELSNER